MGEVTGLGLLAAQEDMLAMVNMSSENVGLYSFSAIPVEQGWECIDGENPVGAL